MARGGRKAQSAMEYLMTYGWAILIIAVVLGALFQLGVFNAGTFAPRAPPGTCQVFRPDGPNTAQFINLEGVCSGELPQYVATVNGFASSYVQATTAFSGNNIPFTISMWINIPSYAPVGGFGVEAVFDQNSGSGTYQSFGPVAPNAGGPGVGFHRCDTSDTGSGFTALSPGTWYFIAGSVNYPSYYFQQDAASAIASNNGNYFVANSINMGIENGGCNGNDFIGEIANVQLYNTSLSANEVQAIYLEGIGGAPIKLQNLVAWWPLNGNANDYSGNNNNGVPTGVTYTNQWTSGYTSP